MLNLEQAQAITARIRGWVDVRPVDDIMAAYEGRVWEAMGYHNWADWCDGELGGFRLPLPQRRSVASDLAGRGMSNRSIAEVVGADERTVRRDRTAANAAVDEPTLGQDGKRRRQPQREPEPEDEIVYTPQEMGRKQVFDLMTDLADCRTCLKRPKPQWLSSRS
jgi:hypothetical protein